MNAAQRDYLKRLLEEYKMQVIYAKDSSAQKYWEDKVYRLSNVLNELEEEL